jgi:hypothetical protein
MKRNLLICLALAVLLIPWMNSFSTDTSSIPPAGASALPKLLLGQVKAHDGLHVEGEGVKTVTLVNKFPVTFKAPPGADLYLWKYPVGWTVEDTSTETLLVKDGSKAEATVSVLVWRVDWDAKKTIKQTYTMTVQIGDVPPGPKPPEPKPPEPKPPEPKPGPVTGLRVVFVMEKGQATLTPAQSNVIYSQEIAKYLDAKCAGGKDGWRRWDKDTSTAAETETWKKLWAAVKPQLGQLPQIVIVTDQSGEVFPLPASVEECLALLRKYGG